MNAAAIPLPDKAFQDALIAVLTVQARGGDGWHVDQTDGAISASIVRTVSPSNAEPKR
jgi:hypothetical protein